MAGWSLVNGGRRKRNKKAKEKKYKKRRRRRKKEEEEKAEEEVARFHLLQATSVFMNIHRVGTFANFTKLPSRLILVGL